MFPYHSKFCYHVLITKSRAIAFTKAVDSLRTKYVGIIRSIKDSVPGTASTFKSRSQELIDWLASTEKDIFTPEIFFPKSRTDTVFVLQIRDIKELKTSWGKSQQKKSGVYLTVHIFSSHSDKREEFDEFDTALLASIQKEFKLKKLPKMEAIAYVNDAFENIVKEKHNTPHIPKDIVPILNQMQDSKFRRIVMRAKQAKEPTVENIVKSTGLNESTVLPVLAKITEVGLLEKQHNVVCSNCKTTLARVANKSSLTQMAKDKVLCPSCKTPIAEDSYTDCYVSTEITSNLLDGNKWLDMFVRVKLHSLTPILSVITCVKHGPNELDLVANIDGALMLMELKDSRFSMGHAYSFVGKCSQYRPQIPVILATEGIDQDVKDYIKKIPILSHFTLKIFQKFPKNSKKFFQNKILLRYQELSEKYRGMFCLCVKSSRPLIYQHLYQIDPLDQDMHALDSA